MINSPDTPFYNIKLKLFTVEQSELKGHRAGYAKLPDYSAVKYQAAKLVARPMGSPGLASQPEAQHLPEAPFWPPVRPPLAHREEGRPGAEVEEELGRAVVVLVVTAIGLIGIEIVAVVPRSCECVDSGRQRRYPPRPRWLMCTRNRPTARARQ